MLLAEAFTAGQPAAPAAERAELDDVLDGHLTRREEHLAALVDEVAAACRAEGAELVFLDATGAGRPAGAGPAPGAAWELGVDLGAIGRAADAIGVVGDTRDPAGVALALDGYRRTVGGDVALELVLRPSRPDCTDASNLAAKLDVARSRGVRAAGFYHYRRAPGRAVGRVANALATSGRD
jgi:hypothetical protein